MQSSPTTAALLKVQPDSDEPHSDTQTPGFIQRKKNVISVGDLNTS